MSSQGIPGAMDALLFISMSRVTDGWSSALSKATRGFCCCLGWNLCFLTTRIQSIQVTGIT
jgi:hypothetical protein